MFRLSCRFQFYDVICLAKMEQKFQLLIPDGDQRHFKVFKYKIDDSKYSEERRFI